MKSHSERLQNLLYQTLHDFLTPAMTLDILRQASELDESLSEQIVIGLLHVFSLDVTDQETRGKMLRNVYYYLSLKRILKAAGLNDGQRQALTNVWLNYSFNPESTLLVEE